MSGGLMSGGRMSGGRLSDGLMSGGLMSAHRLTQTPDSDFGDVATLNTPGPPAYGTH